MFPPAVFHLPFCSSCVAIYRLFLLLYALSRWVSVSSYPPTTPLISWTGSMVSLCSKKSWRAALWTGCWHRNTELSPLPRWSWFPGCRVSFGDTEPKIAVEILLYLPQCLDSLSKPKIQMLLLASCDTGKYSYVLLWGHNPSLLSGLFLWQMTWTLDDLSVHGGCKKWDSKCNESPGERLILQPQEKVLRLESNSFTTGTYLLPRRKKSCTAQEAEAHVWLREKAGWWLFP